MRVVHAQPEEILDPAVTNRTYGNSINLLYTVFSLRAIEPVAFLKLIRAIRRRHYVYADQHHYIGTKRSRSACGCFDQPIDEDFQF